ncbi:MAG: recombination regulator RecX [Candidatus Saccharimonadales bacterium]
MIITAIRSQVKRPDRYSVYVDNEFCCTFSGSELLHLGIHTGQSITELELDDLKNGSQRDKAYHQGLDLILRRVRSEWELREYLKRKAYAPSIIEAVTQKLVDNSYLNDEDFARRWIENRRLLKSTSKRRLRQELLQKHVASEIIDQALTHDATDERQVLAQLISKKRNLYPDKLKLMQYLIRQGYHYDDIKNVLNDQTVEG